MTRAEKKYVYRLPLQVRDYELDCQGIVNNAIYLHYLEHTRHGFCREAGCSFKDMHEQGIDPVLREVNIRYMHSLRSGDEFLSCLNIRRDGARFVFEQDLYLLPDMVPVITAEVVVVCTENGRLTRGEQLASAFSKYL